MKYRLISRSCTLTLDKLDWTVYSTREAGRKGAYRMGQFIASAAKERLPHWPTTES
jgi:hypothetical protein